MRFAPGTSKEKMKAAEERKKAKEGESKAFLKKKADQVAGKDQAKPPVKKEESTTKKVVEAKAPVKAKKEAVLAEARKKIGASEEKRADFKERSKKSQAKRAEKREAAKETSAPAATTPAPAPATVAQTPTTPTATTPTTGDPTLGRLKRKDMDPNRSVMAQRVEHQMKKTGMTREDAKAAVVERREVRQGQIADVQSQYGIGAGQARKIVQYANRNKVAGAEGQPAVANFALAKRVVQMAKNKDLTRKEAAGVINMRKQARQGAAPAQTPTV